MSGDAVQARASVSDPTVYDVSVKPAAGRAYVTKLYEVEVKEDTFPAGSVTVAVTRYTPGGSG